LKKIKVLTSISEIAVTKQDVFLFTNCIQKNDFDVKFILESSFITSIKNNNLLVIYQSENSNNLFALFNDDLLTFEGNYSFKQFFNFEDGLVVYNKDTKCFELLFVETEKRKLHIRSLEFYIKSSRILKNSILYNKIGNKLFFYSIPKKVEIGSVNFDLFLNSNDEIQVIEVGINNNLFLRTKSGKILCYNFNTKEIKILSELVGRYKLYKNTIYAITNDTLQEIDAETGEILKEQSIEHLISSHKFFATGEHKVYEEYIFVMNTGAPAMVAIFDRESLQFVEMLKFDHLIPRGTDHLHWHNKKLYVLDWSKTLHVFEE